MKMTVSSIEIKNIRRFSDLTLNFTSDEGRLIKHTFVMMKNGTGKTTIITLIKGLLDGTAENWSKEEVLSYKPVNQQIDEGTFKISTQFDEKTYIYILKLNYKEGIAKTYSTNAAQGGLGPRRFPLAINDLFTQDFVNRFVFDGEQAAKTMDNKSNEAEDAIKYLYRLDVFDEILRTNQAILKEIQDSQGGAKGSDQSLKNLRTRQDSIKKTIDRLRADEKRLIQEIAEKESQRDALQDEINKIDGQFSKLKTEKNDAEKERDDLKADIDLLIANILNATKSPYLVSEKLCNRMYEFGASMTKLKLPKTTSRDFFIELSNQKVCVCGREISSNEKEAIRKRAAFYLGSDQQSVLNNVKSSLLSSSYNDSLSEMFDNLQVATSNLKIAENRIISIDEKLANAGGEIATQKRKERDAVIGEIGSLEEQKKIITDKNDADDNLTESNNLAKAQAAYDDLESKIASATTTNNALYRKKKIEEITKMLQIEATNRLKDEIIKKSNQKISAVITDDIVEIEKIDKYIQLRGKGGASAGQTLSVAYCFLGTLFEDAELMFPFIIDSPCGSMDFEKRQAVAGILPSLFNQIISFVMSAEVERFADQFYSNADAQFITVVANQTDNSIEIHEGKEFFDSYQRENKEAE